jgi:hypothetical protein
MAMVIYEIYGPTKQVLSHFSKDRRESVIPHKLSVAAAHTKLLLTNDYNSAL